MATTVDTVLNKEKIQKEGFKIEFGTRLEIDFKSSLLRAIERSEVGTSQFSEDWYPITTIMKGKTKQLYNALGVVIWTELNGLPSGLKERDFEDKLKAAIDFGIKLYDKECNDNIATDPICTRFPKQLFDKLFYIFYQEYDEFSAKALLNSSKDQSLTAKIPPFQPDAQFKQNLPTLLNETLKNIVIIHCGIALHAVRCNPIKYYEDKGLRGAWVIDPKNLPSFSSKLSKNILDEITGIEPKNLPEKLEFVISKALMSIPCSLSSHSLTKYFDEDPEHEHNFAKFSHKFVTLRDGLVNAITAAIAESKCRTKNKDNGQKNVETDVTTKSQFSAKLQDLAQTIKQNDHPTAHDSHWTGSCTYGYDANRACSGSLSNCTDSNHTSISRSAPLVSNSRSDCGC